LQIAERIDSRFWRENSVLFAKYISQKPQKQIPAKICSKKSNKKFFPKNQPVQLLALHTRNGVPLFPSLDHLYLPDVRVSKTMNEDAGFAFPFFVLFPVVDAD
jgi:hypothetical protein